MPATPRRSQCSRASLARALTFAPALTFARALTLAVALTGLSACATDRLESAPPKGVDLTGEWQVNTNLSDDPQKMPVDQQGGAGNMRHRHGRGGGGSGGSGGSGGLPPFGMPGGAGGRTGGGDPGEPDGSNDFTGNFNSGPPGDEAAATYIRTAWDIGGPGSSGSSSAGGGGRSRGNRFGHLLDTPDHLTIEQSGGKLTIQSKSAGGDLTTDVYTSGQKSDVPMGQATAQRSVGWRGPIFVIDTQVKSGPTKEQDFALDDDGRLIVSTLMSGGHLPKVDFKRVYDRVKGAQGVRQ